MTWLVPPSSTCLYSPLSRSAPGPVARSDQTLPSPQPPVSASLADCDPAWGRSDLDRMLLWDVKLLPATRMVLPLPGGRLQCPRQTCWRHSWTWYLCPHIHTASEQRVGWSQGTVGKWDQFRYRVQIGKTTLSGKNYESSEACPQEELRGSRISGYDLDYMELGRKKVRESGGNHSFNSFSDFYELYCPDSCGINEVIAILEATCSCLCSLQIVP